MFTFFHRKRKVVVDCYTVDSFAYNYTPIVKAIKTVPSWWKTLPSIDYESRKLGVFSDSFQYQNTMKNCYGFLELYKRGVVIEAWADFNFKVSNAHYDCISTSPNEKFNVPHKAEEYGNSFEKHFHGKLISPWSLAEKTGLHFLNIGAEWSLDDYTLKVLPGVVEYNCNTATHIHIMIPKAEVDHTYTFHIPAGLPLLHIIPLNDDVDVEFINHLISESEWISIKNRASFRSFSGFKNLMNLNKRNKKRDQESKCPFQ